MSSGWAAPILGFLNKSKNLLDHPQVGFPVLVELLVADLHAFHPILLPLVQFGGFDSCDCGP